MIFPEPLKRGDKVAFVSPASPVKDEYVEMAMARFFERGYEPVLSDYALGHTSGSYAAGRAQRLMDLYDALEDREIKAIFCNRGGYGCVSLINEFTDSFVANNPKWIIGFSDVSALLAKWFVSGVASIHGPMAKHLASMPANDPCTLALFNILETGGDFSYIFESSPLNRSGEATGILRGGNLAVLNGLAATPYDILNYSRDEDYILFFEDISEPIYAVERMLWRLYLSGALTKAKALIFGQFTEYKPDRNFRIMEEMISGFVNSKSFSIPVIFNFPTGHTDVNFPLVVGSRIKLIVDSSQVSISSMV